MTARFDFGFRASTLWLLALALDACASDEATPSIEPTLASIQAEIFTPRCSNGACHGAGSPARGLDLRQGNAYASLVNVVSPVEQGAIRVVPGDPAASLLVQVLVEKTSSKTRQMPPGLVLELGEVDAVKGWIAAGAPAQ